MADEEQGECEEKRGPAKNVAEQEEERNGEDEDDEGNQDSKLKEELQ